MLHLLHRKCEHTKPYHRTNMETQKPVHTVVLDTGAIIKNVPSVSTLLSSSERLVTVPAILSEIKDAATRSRVETTLRPFLTLRTPRPSSVKVVADFARRTGDLAVLSRADIDIISLTYEIECERNGGDWRLRSVPGQKRLNGSPPEKFVDESLPKTNPEETAQSRDENCAEDRPVASKGADEDTRLHRAAAPEHAASTETDASFSSPQNTVPMQTHVKPIEEPENAGVISSGVEELRLGDGAVEDSTVTAPKIDSAHNSAESQNGSDSDSEGWITPSNLKAKQAEDAGSKIEQASEPKVMQAAVLTTDYAMQNVILQMNLNLLSPSLTRVKHLKTFVLRCHACFQVTKDMAKQFCPRCGQPSLTRASCTTSANGEFKLHLKKTMQWNHRGDKYSIPKAVHGSANGRMKGGGKGGWGNDLILAEDQKEYQRAATIEKKQKERNLMDEDYLPSILTGDRGRTGGRVKVGAGRNVNARKR